MFRRCHHVLRLQTLHKRNTQPCGQKWVFAIGLFGATVTRIAAQIEDGRKELAYAPTARILSDDDSGLANQIWIPGCSHRNGRGEDRTSVGAQSAKALTIDQRGNAKARLLRRNALDEVRDLGSRLCIHISNRQADGSDPCDAEVLPQRLRSVGAAIGKAVYLSPDFE